MIKISNTAVENVTKSLENKLKKKLSSAISGNTLALLGKMAITEMKKRTLRGVDYRAIHFPAYSKAYLKKKKRKPGGVKAVGGSLLKEIKFRRTGKNKGIVEITGNRRGSISSQKLAEIHNKGLGDMPKRTFLGWKKGSNEDFRLRRAAKKMILKAMHM